jgi:hypothetical protein
MVAIWPAGPPKDNAAMRSQTRRASAKLTPWVSARRGKAACISFTTIPMCRKTGRDGADAVAQGKLVMPR